MENKNNKENKKSNKIFNIFLAIAVLGTVGYTGYRLYDEFWSKGNEGIYEHANTEKKSGRKIDYFDLEEIEKETDRSLYYTELEREPYKENTLSGGQMVITSGSGYEKYLKEINGLYDNGEPAFHSAGTSLRHPEDELVDPEQTLAFNTFVSYTKALDDNGQETKLSDKEVETYATMAEEIAKVDKSPAYYYIGDLVRNLKGKNPTLSSVYYLLEANRISVRALVEEEELDLSINDYSHNLDTSYQSEQEKSLVEDISYSTELINKNSAILHYMMKGSYTKYALEDWGNTQSNNFGIRTNSRKNGDDMISAITHYKDVSNFFLAEYVITAMNQNLEEDDIMASDYSYYKPAFTWCISPKIEEIASAYYDIVEPQVYQGTFTTRNAAYQKTLEKLDNKYTLTEIESAIQTYEYWALIE